MLGLEDSDVLGDRQLAEVGEAPRWHPVSGAAGVGRRAGGRPRRTRNGSRRAGSVMRSRLPAAGNGHGGRGSAAGRDYRPGGRFDGFVCLRRAARVATMDECMTALKGILGDIAAHPRRPRAWTARCPAG